MALRMSSSAFGGSAISPLRTPRDRHWPSPMMFSVPAAFTSPTAAQIFEVPISSPTIREAGSNIFFPDGLRVDVFGDVQRRRAGRHENGWNVAGHGQIQRGD